VSDCPFQPGPGLANALRAAESCRLRDSGSRRAGDRTRRAAPGSHGRTIRLASTGLGRSTARLLAHQPIPYPDKGLLHARTLWMPRASASSSRPLSAISCANLRMGGFCQACGGPWSLRSWRRLRCDIFGSPSKGVSRFGRGHRLLPCLCLRPLRSWHLLAKASGLLFCRRRVWRDGLSHQLYASGHSAPHDRRPDTFSPWCGRMMPRVGWRQAVGLTSGLDTSGAGDRICGAGSISFSAAGQREGQDELSGSTNLGFREVAGS
jgi:hypothetical protein